MRPRWEKKKLGEVCGFIRGPFGGSLKKAFFKPEGYAVYEQKHAIYNQFENIRYFVDEAKFCEMRRFEVFPGDLIMSCSGTMGKVAIVPESIKRGIINQALLKLTPSNDLDVEFLKLWMESPNFQDQLGARTKGVAIKNVASVKVLKEIEVALPPLPEQKHIVVILDEAFEGIDKAVANAEQNLTNARELFESYLNSVFTEKGEGWINTNLSDLMDISHGFAFKGPDFKTSSNNAKPIVLTPGNYAEDGKLYFTKKNTKRFTGNLPEDYLFEVGDLTVVMTDLSSKMKILGKPAFVDMPNILHNQRIGRVIFKESGIVSRFVYYYLRTRMVSEKIKETSTGTMVRHTAPKRILALAIPLPPTQTEQVKIVSALNELSDETKRLEAIYQQKLDALVELKQSILQKAFSGELTTQPDNKLKEAVA